MYATQLKASGRRIELVPELEALFTAQQLAGYLRVPVTTLYQWRHRREGPPGFRVGRHLRYRRRDIEEWIECQLQDVSR